MRMSRRTLIAMAVIVSGLALSAALTAGAIQAAVLWAWIGNSTSVLNAGVWPGIAMTSLLALCRATWTGCFILAFEAARRRMVSRGCELYMLVSGPAFWVILEQVYEQIMVWLGLPFAAAIGYSQALNPVTIQAAAAIGVHGVSFLVLFLNIALAGWVASRSSELPDAERVAARHSMIAAMVVLIVWPAAGAARLALSRRDSATQLLRIAILPGNIPPYLKYDKSKSNDRKRHDTQQPDPLQPHG